MSYTRRHSPLGGITDVASAAAAVVGDPCLPEVATLVLRLHAAEQPKRGGGGGGGGGPAGPPAPPARGIGLCAAVKPLRTIVWLREKPHRIPMAVGGVAMLFVLAGYALGRGTR